MAQCSRRAMRPAAVMAAVYRAALDRLRRRGWLRLDEPVVGAAAGEDLARACGTACCEPVFARACHRRRDGGLAGRGAARRCRASPSFSMKQRRRPAAAAALISMRRSAAASTTATICCSQGNRAAMAYVAAIGAADTLTGPAEAAFPFLDLATGERWVAAARNGAACRGGFSTRHAAFPGRRLCDYLAALRLACGPAQRHRRRRCSIRQSPLFRRFWQPLTVAILNTGSGRGVGGAAGAGGGRDLRPGRRRVPAAGAERRAVGVAGRAGARASAPLRRRAAPSPRACAALEFDDGRVTGLLLRGRHRAARRRRGGRAGGAGAGGDAPYSRPRRARPVPRHRQCPLPHRGRRRRAAFHRHHRRHGRMGVPQARGAVGDGERRRAT